MKQMLMDMMIAMMPAMKPMVWIGAAALGLGLVALVLRFTMGRHGWLKTTLKWSSVLLLILGAFFVIAQFMGQWLGMNPQINFGDPTKFEFKLMKFWQIGAIGLVAGLIYKTVAKKS